MRYQISCLWRCWPNLGSIGVSSGSIFLKHAKICWQISAIFLYKSKKKTAKNDPTLTNLIPATFRSWETSESILERGWAGLQHTWRKQKITFWPRDLLSLSLSLMLNLRRNVGRSPNLRGQNCIFGKKIGGPWKCWANKPSFVEKICGWVLNITENKFSHPTLIFSSFKIFLLTNFLWIS